jgi:hypothetical protein
MISIICVANNEKILNDYLLASLKRQKLKDYEIIIVNAKKEGFSSASEALNYGADQSHGDILLFVHQDVRLEEEDFLKRLQDYCNNYDFDFGGVVGAVVAKRKKIFSHSIVYSSLICSDNRFIEIDRPVEVEAIDECVMFIRKKDFHYFDDYGSTWHFYGVEYSLRCRLENKKVVVFPLKVYHLSEGNLNDSYWKTLKKVAKRYKKKIKIIATTCGSWETNLLLFAHIYRTKRYLKRRNCY